MSEYINRELAKASVDFQDVKSAAQAKKAIDDVPSADVVEVVRCKDCMFYHKYKALEQCKRNPNWDSWDAPIVTETDYCSYGERKDK